MRRGPRIPLRKRLLVRLLTASVLIATCSVAATAWLAVTTTTHAIEEAQGQDLAADTRILSDLSGYAATHPDWTHVASTVRALAARTGRRIALTTTDGTAIADSARPGTALPSGAAATVDPLHTDTYTQPGTQLSAIDPRVVGPYRLTTAEQTRLDRLATGQQRCLAHFGVQTTIERAPSGRPLLTDSVPTGHVPAQCNDGLLTAPTVTERKALDDLLRRSLSCLQQAGLTNLPAFYSVNVAGNGPALRYFPTPVAGTGGAARAARTCVDSANRAQLAPYVAPVAKLYLGVGDTTAPHFDMSPANKAKVIEAAVLVLAVTVAVTAVIATRLVRPLRALTEAAQQPPDQHVRVPVTTRDETGILALAFNDLTERRERLEAQRKAMVSDIAHELRTPLTNIRGWLEVTRDGIVDPDPALLASLHDEALLLQRIIDDLQDLAAADAGTLRLHREPVRVTDLLDQVAAAHHVAADTTGIALRTDADGTQWLDADPVRMRQVLGNLVSNALRHTPATGTVTLTARQDGGDVVLTVADTGTGIAPDDLPHIFDRFWRAEKSRSRRTGGSGLGLAIVRHLIAAHDGTVTATSELGAGTVFALRLPTAQAPEDADPVVLAYRAGLAASSEPPKSR